MRKCVADYIKEFPNYNKKIEIKESDLIYAMKEGNHRTVNMLKESKYEWNSSELIDVLDLCVKYNVLINCNVYEKLVKNNNISTVMFLLLNFHHDAHDIQHVVKYITSDEMAIIFLSHGGKSIGWELFNLAYKNNFTKTLKLLKNYLTFSQIIEILDLCDLNLVMTMEIESMVKHLTNVSVNYHNRIITYGKLDQFDLLGHCRGYSVLSCMNYIELGYINFTGLRKLLKNKVYNPDFSINNTIKLVEHEYFDQILPLIISDYLVFELSKIVVSYL